MPKRKTASQKAFKPAPQIVHAISSLQNVAQDADAWSTNEQMQLPLLETSLTKLEKLQSNPPFRNLIPHSRTADHFEAFSQWLSTHHLNLADQGLRLDFANHDDRTEDNVTLFATRAIPEDDILVTVPSSFMLTSMFNASRPSLTSFARAVPAIATNPSLALVLALLAEAADTASFYTPYINILPRKCNIPFATFTASDLLALHPSPAAQIAINTLRAQVRDYTYVFQAVMKHRPSDLPLSILSFANWRWAVSVVMTRQNSLPVPAGWQGSHDRSIMALVPLWDMFNHDVGKLSSGVLLENDDIKVECRAMRTFEANEAVTMFYGKRSNVRLAIFSGFVHEGNPFDVVPVSVLMSKETPFAALKARVLLKKGINVEEVVQGGDATCIGWACHVDVGAGHCGLATALAVATVFVMDKEEMTTFLKGEDSLPDVCGMNGCGNGKNGSNEEALNLVENAILNRLDVYKRRAEESAQDRAHDRAHDRAQSGASKLIDGLHGCEMSHLTNALQSVRARRNERND